VGRFLRTPLCSSLVRWVFPRPTFVITTNPGALLGNQLTIFAHVIACAREGGRDIWGASFFMYAQFFEGASRDVFARFPERRFLIPGARRARATLYYYVFARLVRVLITVPDPPLRDLVLITDYERRHALESREFSALLGARRVAVIEGYFFRASATSLRRHADVIKRYFRPLKRHEANAAAVVGAARADADIVVGVHLRKFGGAHDDNAPSLYRFQHGDEMDRAMRQTADLFSGKRVTFLLLSNRRVDPRRYPDFALAEGTGHVVEDLHALSLCDYILASTYSSFSRWASFYGDVPLYQVDDPARPFSLEEFRVQIPGFFDPSDESGSIQV